jgi:hypothetical protein
MTRIDPRRLAVLLVLVTVSLSACGGAASSPPASPSPSPAASVAPSPSPEASPSDAPSSAPPESPFAAATAALEALDSYEYKVELNSLTNVNNAVSGTHSVISGVTVNRPVAAGMTTTQFFDMDGTLSGEQGVIVIGDAAWVRDGGEGAPWFSVPADSVSVYARGLTSFGPVTLFGKYFEALEGNFTMVGPEPKNGVDTTHYQGDANVGALLAGISGFDGDWTSDVWIANDGGFLVASEARGQAAGGADAGSFAVIVNVSKPNAAAPINPPM